MENPYQIVQLSEDKFLVTKHDLPCDLFPFPFDTLKQARSAVARVRILEVIRYRKENNIAFS